VNGGNVLSLSALFVGGERTGRFHLGGNELLTAPDWKGWITYEDFSIPLLKKSNNRNTFEKGLRSATEPAAPFMQTPEMKHNLKLRRIAVGLQKQVTVLVMSLLSVTSFHEIGHAQNIQESTMNSNAVITYKTVQVNGLKIFYREAGDPSKPTILLLHGFPSSSHMYRDLIPKLADQFHLVAPDDPGSGNMDYPSEAQFKPTFANLADVMANFVTTIGLQALHRVHAGLRGAA
jgi:hypothetical protein